MRSIKSSIQYSSIQVYKYTSIHVFKYSSIQVFKYSSIEFTNWLLPITNNVKSRDPIGSKNVKQQESIGCDLVPSPHNPQCTVEISVCIVNSCDHR